MVPKRLRGVADSVPSNSKDCIGECYVDKSKCSGLYNLDPEYEPFFGDLMLPIE